MKKTVTLVSIVATTAAFANNPILAATKKLPTSCAKLLVSIDAVGPQGFAKNSEIKAQRVPELVSVAKKIASDELLTRINELPPDGMLTVILKVEGISRAEFPVFLEELQESDVTAIRPRYSGINSILKVEAERDALIAAISHRAVTGVFTPRDSLDVVGPQGFARQSKIKAQRVPELGWSVAQKIMSEDLFTRLKNVPANEPLTVILKVEGISRAEFPVFLEELQDNDVTAIRPRYSGINSTLKVKAERDALIAAISHRAVTGVFTPTQQ